MTRAKSPIIGRCIDFSAIKNETGRSTNATTINASTNWFLWLGFSNVRLKKLDLYRNLLSHKDDWTILAQVLHPNMVDFTEECENDKPSQQP